MKKVLLILLFPVLTMASGVGNGGFVIRCGSQVMPLEYFEAMQSGLALDIPKPIWVQGQSYLTQRIYAILNRLKKLDPNRAEYYRAAYYRYFLGLYADNQSLFLNIQGLTLNSSQAADPTLQLKFGLGSVQVPGNCELVLTAQQELPIEKESQRRHLQLNIRLISTVWNQLDLDTQAGIIMHELFYHEYLQRNIPPQNSVGVRHLLGLLMSSKFQNLTRQDWNSELRKKGFSPMFPDFEFQQSFCQDGSGLCLFFWKPNTFPPMTTFSNEDFAVPYTLINSPGEIEICQKKVNVVSNTHYFIFGEVPAESIFSQSQDVDLSCYTNNERIELQVGKSCKAVMEKLVGVTSQINLKEMGRNCDSFLKNYSNPNLKTIGQPKVFVFYNQNTKSLNLSINVVPFSDVQVLMNGAWIRVNDSCAFNLQDGKIIDIDGK